MTALQREKPRCNAAPEDIDMNEHNEAACNGKAARGAPGRTLPRPNSSELAGGFAPTGDGKEQPDARPEREHRISDGQEHFIVEGVASGDLDPDQIIAVLDAGGEVLSLPGHGVIGIDAAVVGQLDKRCGARGGPTRPAVAVPDAAMLLLKSAEAAAIVGLSRAKWLQLDNQGAIPEPVRFGKAVRWARSELTAWVRAGCPNRGEWEKTKERLTFT
jgi:predicted DNA-binding transcriptional regulator AlpA